MIFNWMLTNLGNYIYQQIISRQFIGEMEFVLLEIDHWDVFDDLCYLMSVIINVWLNYLIIVNWMTPQRIYNLLFGINNYHTNLEHDLPTWEMI
jgi:hypothetical protein